MRHLSSARRCYLQCITYSNQKCKFSRDMRKNIAIEWEESKERTRKAYYSRRNVDDVYHDIFPKQLIERRRKKVFLEELRVVCERERAKHESSKEKKIIDCALAVYVRKVQFYYVHFIMSTVCESFCEFFKPKHYFGHW